MCLLVFDDRFRRYSLEAFSHRHGRSFRKLGVHLQVGGGFPQVSAFLEEDHIRDLKFMQLAHVIVASHSSSVVSARNSISSPKSSAKLTASIVDNCETRTASDQNDQDGHVFCKTPLKSSPERNGR